VIQNKFVFVKGALVLMPLACKPNVKMGDIKINNLSLHSDKISWGMVRNNEKKQLLPRKGSSGE
jgi:hypothetical protein